MFVSFSSKSMNKNSKISCLEPGCTFSGVRVSQLRSHLKSEHDFFFEETQKDFEDFSGMFYRNNRLR